MRKIALEEHFMAPGFSHYEKAVEDMMDQGAYQSFVQGLSDFDGQRLELMNKAGIDICVLSQTSPGVQVEQDTQAAIRQAQFANDFLKQRIDEHPKRFAGFAHLAMQDPTAASAELLRCVKDLGFVGALINGHTHGVYLDDRSFIPFWECVADLDVPIYLHPADPYDVAQAFKGRPEISGPTWAWTVETATHFLRLVASGLFDRLPTVKIILGHMGEALPFMPWRMDSRWKIMKQKHPLKLQPSEYLKQNMLITTSGVCDNGPLLCSIGALGEDRVLFSTDYPYESVMVANDFIENAPISDEVKAKVCHLNARRWLKLSDND